MSYSSFIPIPTPKNVKEILFLEVIFCRLLINTCFQGSLEEWLQVLRLEDYLGPLEQQGYRTVEDVTTLAWEDLEDIGMVKLGHQKKLLLAIRRVQDLRSGKRFQPNVQHPQVKMPHQPRYSVRSLLKQTRDIVPFVIPCLEIRFLCFAVKTRSFCIQFCFKEYSGSVFVC